MDVRSTQPVTGIAEAIQSTAAQAGVKIEIIPGDGKQTLTKYRARTHDIYIGVWGPDYQDPHTNAQTFASNPDNKDDASSKTLAWRNAWETPELGPAVDAAIWLRRTRPSAPRSTWDMQKKVMADSPFVVMFQQTEVAAVRANVKGYELGPPSTTTSSPGDEGVTLTAAPEPRIRGEGGRTALRFGAAVGRFVVTLVVTLTGLLAVTFLIGRVIPIDPVLAVVGDRAPKAVYDRARLEMGLDLPLPEQFWIYVKKAVTGDLGTSVLTTNPVLTTSPLFPATIELATLGTLIGVLIGVPLGVYAAVRAGSIGDQIVRVLGLVGYSVPIFWLGLMALLLFYAKLDWVAGPGRLDIAYDYMVTPVTNSLLIDSLMQGQVEVFFNALSHIILPACLLGYFSLAYISRMTRSFMLNELSQEYVITARVKGLSRRG